jgi:hypothetical protein
VQPAAAWRNPLGCLLNAPAELIPRAEGDLYYERAAMRKHRWIAAVIYELSEDEARRAATGEVVNLQHKHRIGVDGPGCLNCERPYEEVQGAPCDPPTVKEQP